MIGDLLKISLISFLWFFLDDLTALLSTFFQETLLNGAFKVGVILPRSRTHEQEADLVGCKLVSRSCGDPRSGVLLWEKMEYMVC